MLSLGGHNTAPHFQNWWLSWVDLPGYYWRWVGNVMQMVIRVLSTLAGLPKIDKRTLKYVVPFLKFLKEIINILVNCEKMFELFDKICYP